MDQNPIPSDRQPFEQSNRRFQDLRAPQVDDDVNLDTAFTPQGRDPLKPFAAASESMSAAHWGMVGGALSALGGMLGGAAVDTLTHSDVDKSRLAGESPSMTLMLDPGIDLRNPGPETRRMVEGLILQAGNPELEGYERQQAERDLANMDPGSQKLLPIAWRAYERLPASAPAWQGEAYRQFLMTRQLGIEYPERLPREHLNELIQNRLNLTPDGRPLAIVVWPKGDHNGAFYGGKNEFQELIAAGYRVLYFEAESDTQFMEALFTGTRLGTSFEQRADLLIVGGHGSRERLWLERDNHPLPDGRGTIDFSDEKRFKAIGLGATLAPGGQIVLDSCSNGEGRAEMDNMANFMRRVFPHAKAQGIWSATVSYRVEHFTFDKNGRLINVDFHVPEYRAFRDGSGQKPQSQPADIRA